MEAKSVGPWPASVAQGSKVKVKPSASGQRDTYPRGLLVASESIKSDERSTVMPDRPEKISNPKPAFGRRGVVAVILRDDQFLVIRRSQAVTAPGKLCFPGGGIEPGEGEEEALVREMLEELALPVVPRQRLWRSMTPWGTKLAWWLADCDSEIAPVPDPSEVEEVFWMRQLELVAASDLLPSVPQFIQAWRTGKLALPIDWTPSS